MSKSLSTKKQEQQDAAITELRELLKPGDTVHCVLRNVSRSGMSRVIDLVIVEKGKDRPRNIGYLAAWALEMSFDRNRGGVKVSGCGMDMGFHLVYELAYSIFKNDPRLAKWQAKQPEHGPRDPGYALSHRWL